MDNVNVNSDNIVLRDVVDSDLPIFFEQQRDPEANRMAAFTSKDPENRDAFMAHWARILQDPTTTNQTILLDGLVVGNISSYKDEDGRLEICYWIDKSYWGKGIATRAASLLISRTSTRPLYARAAKDNIGSLRVLEKCGFSRIGEDSGYANARAAVTEEYVLKLE